MFIHVLPATERGDDTHTLELLGDASKLARQLKLAVTLVLPSDGKPDPSFLYRHGCDRILRLPGGPSSESVAASLGFEEFRLLFLPGNARGEEVAAYLGARPEYLWIPDGVLVSATRTGQIEVRAVTGGGKLLRNIRPPEGRTPLVSMGPGVAEANDMGRDGEPETAEGKAAPGGGTRTLGFVPADPSTVDISHAHRVVAAGRGAGGPAGVALVVRLAECLRASLGASRMAVDLGWVDYERQVGQTGRTVRPDLYVACGISGQSHHLAGMRESRHIVAVNTDRRSPIHEVAHLSLRCDLRAWIPAVIERLEKRKKEASRDA